MADRLSASLLSEFSQRNLRQSVSRTAILDNDAISSVIITDRVKKWGKVKFEVYNKHPREPGVFRMPVLTLTVDNSDHYFDLGGSIFPNGLDDIKSTYVALFIQVSSFTPFSFTGRLREPEYGDEKALRLVVEHPLTALTQRTWARQDRIGGDTGIDWYFNS